MSKGKKIYREMHCIEKFSNSDFKVKSKVWDFPIFNVFPLKIFVKK